MKWSMSNIRPTSSGHDDSTNREPDDETLNDGDHFRIIGVRKLRNTEHLHKIWWVEIKERLDWEEKIIKDERLGFCFGHRWYDVLRITCCAFDCCVFFFYQYWCTNKFLCFFSLNLSVWNCLEFLSSYQLIIASNFVMLEMSKKLCIRRYTI